MDEICSIAQKCFRADFCTIRLVDLWLMVESNVIVLDDCVQLHACFMPAVMMICGGNLIQLANQFDMFFL